MKTYGLVGKSLSHSFSKLYFTNKFKKLALSTEAQYLNFELKSITEVTELTKIHKNIHGFNVTIPFKESILPYLDDIDSVASSVGAVNTVKIIDDCLIGYNTDVTGFKNSIKPFFEPKHARALIFGTGGASKAIAYVLAELAVPFYFVSRTKTASNIISYNDLDEKNIGFFKFLINTTPVGTFPNVEECLNIPYEGISADHLVMDLIYNPEESMFLSKAKLNGAIAINGKSMLRLQAEASWDIWKS